ncbi:MAG: hypothetical protein ACI8PZ_005508 [Myxococcota bacterium]|jgi:hypothetical protein
MNVRALGLLALFAAGAGCDGITPTLNNGKVGVAFDSEPLPLLPPGFPIYPTSFSTESLGVVVDEALADVTFRSGLNAVADDICIDLGLTDVCLDQLLNNSAFNRIDDAIIDEVPEVRGWVERYALGQLDFFNPAPMGAGVNEQIGRTFRGAVTFDDVRLKMTVRNRTEDLWGVPLAFNLFVGSGESVTNRTALVTAAEGDVNTFILLPGETKTIETGNLPALVDALNDARTLSIDYDTNIEVSELDPAAFSAWFGASKADSDGNGVADALSKWGLVFEKFEIEVSGKGEIDLPIDTPAWLDDLVEQ